MLDCRNESTWKRERVAAHHGRGVSAVNLRRSELEVGAPAMEVTMEQALLQLRQEVLLLRATVQGQAVQATTTWLQHRAGRKLPVSSTSKVVCGKQEFTGNEEDCHKWSTKPESFSAALLTESEMMFEWSAEQVTEIIIAAVEEEFGPAALKEERRVPKLDAVCQQRHTAQVVVTTTRRITLSPTCARIPWMLVGNCRIWSTRRQWKEEKTTISPKMITVLTRYRPIVLELI